jgi:hypothetical protein
MSKLKKAKAMNSGTTNPIKSVRKTRMHAGQRRTSKTFLVTKITLSRMEKSKLITKYEVTSASRQQGHRFFT